MPPPLRRATRWPGRSARSRRRSPGPTWSAAAPTPASRCWRPPGWLRAPTTSRASTRPPSPRSARSWPAPAPAAPPPTSSPSTSRPATRSRTRPPPAWSTAAPSTPGPAPRSRSDGGSGELDLQPEGHDAAHVAADLVADLEGPETLGALALEVVQGRDLDRAVGAAQVVAEAAAAVVQGDRLAAGRRGRDHADHQVADGGVAHVHAHLQAGDGPGLADVQGHGRGLEVGDGLAEAARDDQPVGRLRDGQPGRGLGVEAAVAVPGAVALGRPLAVLEVDAVARPAQDVLDLVPAQIGVPGQHQRGHPGRPRAGAGGAAEGVGVVALRVVAARAGDVGGPDPGGERRRAPLGGEGEVVAGEGAEHGVAEVAVDAALAAVVAGGNGQDLLVAGVAVQVDRLVAVAGGEQHNAALAPATLGDRVV